MISEIIYNAAYPVAVVFTLILAFIALSKKKYNLALSCGLLFIGVICQDFVANLLRTLAIITGHSQTYWIQLLILLLIFVAGTMVVYKLFNLKTNQKQTIYPEPTLDVLDIPSPDNTEVTKSSQPAQNSTDSLPKNKKSGILAAAGTFLIVGILLIIAPFIMIAFTTANADTSTDADAYFSLLIYGLILQFVLIPSLFLGFLSVLTAVIITVINIFKNKKDSTNQKSNIDTL